MAVTATTYTTPPRVELSYTTPASTVGVTITRAAGGETWGVRGASGSLVGLAGLVTDWETPLGVACTYLLTYLDVSGATLGTDTATVTLADVGVDWVWLSDPIDQTSPLLVQMLTGSDESRTYPADLRSSQASGRRHGYATVGQRASLGAWPLALWAEGAEAAVTLRTLILESLDLCVRASSKLQLPPVFYGVTESPEESLQVYGADAVISTWRMTLTPSTGPGVDAVRAAWSWQDVVDAEATWTTTLAAYPTWADLIRGPV